jgi:hypothetical protein
VPNRVNKHAAPTELGAFAEHEFYKHGAPTALLLNPTTRVFNDLLSLLLRALFQKNAQFGDRFLIFSPSSGLLNANQCRQIYAFETHSERFDVDMISM